MYPDIGRSIVNYLEMLASAGKLGLTVVDANLGVIEAAYSGFVRGISKSREPARSLYDADQLFSRPRFVN